MDRRDNPTMKRNTLSVRPKSPTSLQHIPTGDYGVAHGSCSAAEYLRIYDPFIAATVTCSQRLQLFSAFDASGPFRG
ncbi:hypothetical protein BAUCODRAFT_31052 [Baudoinia panamericana UAMH 10762]|uniref:Uncharacterized protein n=1 Tax=Baudoinia panamericana (strain UAMH 10762) TaxID=717646 RepID=M2LVU4_BAUPA|nr:uncharacterized protein BAUCODRAFT_31052 [Baudoinia panamericana UAMH 10762]EMC98787.1 hypothetical protein BAUCODRAFT_31052 [Baudoinia panamericana UAMH 10762]